MAGKGRMIISQEMELGLEGTTFIKDTNVWTLAGNGSMWTSILCKEATVFATLTDATRDGDDLDDGVESFPAGTLLRGRFTSIELTSGAVYAYKSRGSGAAANDA